MEKTVKHCCWNCGFFDNDNGTCMLPTGGDKYKPVTPTMSGRICPAFYVNVKNKQVVFTDENEENPQVDKLKTDTFYGIIQ